MALQGRFHLYEGYTPRQVTFPIRVMQALEVDILIVTNAAGGLAPRFSAGELMLITDHINVMGGNPLIGPNDERIGPRFPDMSQAYDPELGRIALEVARRHQIPLHQGIYAGLAGPSFETPAEIRMLIGMGGLVVGMSTVPEVIVAHQMDIRIFAVSVITDLGVPGKIQKLTHQDVIDAAAKTAPKLTSLIIQMITG